MSDASEPHETCIHCGVLEVAYACYQTEDGDAICGACVERLKLEECPRCGFILEGHGADEAGVCDACWNDIASKD